MTRLNEEIMRRLVRAIAECLDPKTRYLFEEALAWAQAKYDAGDDGSAHVGVGSAAFHVTYKPKTAEELAREQAHNAAAHNADMMGGGSPASSRSFREDPNY